VLRRAGSVGGNDHARHRRCSYQPGTYSFTKEKIGTRYALIAIRILVDPSNPRDFEQVHALQDAVKVEQPGGPGRFEIPNWDPVSQKKVRDALLVLNSTLPDLRRAFGRRDQVDPVRHLIATASAWGGNPDRDALYLNVTPSRNDGRDAAPRPALIASSCASRCASIKGLNL
jgi:hypothetical protein